MGCNPRDRFLFYPRMQFKLQTELDNWFELASVPGVQADDLPPLTLHQVFQSLRLMIPWEPTMGNHFMEQLGLNSFQPPPSGGGGGGR